MTGLAAVPNGPIGCGGWPISWSAHSQSRVGLRDARNCIRRRMRRHKQGIATSSNAYRLFEDAAALHLRKDLRTLETGRLIEVGRNYVVEVRILLPRRIRDRHAAGHEALREHCGSLPNGRVSPGSETHRCVQRQLRKHPNCVGTTYKRPAEAVRAARRQPPAPAPMGPKAGGCTRGAPGMFAHGPRDCRSHIPSKFTGYVSTKWTIECVTPPARGHNPVARTMQGYASAAKPRRSSPNPYFELLEPLLLAE